MMNLLKASGVTLTAALMFGCASPAQVENMKVDESVNITFDENLNSSIELNQVGGGEETNPMWTSEIGNKEFEAALKSSLQSQYLLSRDNQATYDLSATVRYVLVEKSTNKIIFDELIKAPFTATFGDAFSGVERLRVANEGSAKSNITQFLQKLSQLKIDTSKIELTSKL
jgi:hypothetical protein